MVICLSVSPDGQFLVSGDEAGVVRLWEVQTSRLLKSWDLNKYIDNGEEVSVVVMQILCAKRKCNWLKNRLLKM